MRTKLHYIAPLLVAGTAAAAITAAPIAAAASAPAPALHGACDAGVSGSICSSTGDAEINDSPPPVSFDPYGDGGFLLGYGGGFHGGGGGHGR
jgi:hypothetical protein